MNKRYLLLALPALLLGSCSTNPEPTSQSSMASSTSISTPTPEEPPVSLPPVGEDELGGGQYDDESETDATDISALKEVLELLSTKRRYTYETTYSISGATSRVIDHYGEHYFYEENLTRPQDSFGLAEEVENGQPSSVFRFYVDDSKEGLDRYSSSIYEYLSLDDSDPEPLEGVFSPFGVAGLHSFYQGAFDEMTGIKLSDFEYLVTSSSTYSIFQYMTQIGSSISDSMTACRITLLSLDPIRIQVVIELGDSGDVTSILTALDSTPYDDLDQALEEGTIKGEKPYSDVIDLFENTLSKNNYTALLTSTETDISNTAKLTENYFVFDYDSTYNSMGYLDFGYMFLPANTEVDIEAQRPDGTYEVTQKDFSVSYSSGYEFQIEPDGKVHFVNFIGPLENGAERYIEVESREDLDELPEEDLSENYLYIVRDENRTYRYTLLSGTEDSYGFTPYDTWINSVGDFPLTQSGGTFYTSATALGGVARYYMEKDRSRENTYYSADSGIVSTAASTLFCFGFDSSTSWMSYAERFEAEIHRSVDGNIDGATLSEYIALPSGDGTARFSMEISDIGTTEIPTVQKVYETLLEQEVRV